MARAGRTSFVGRADGGGWGFASCDIAPIDHPMFRFYLLQAPA